MIIRSFEEPGRKPLLKIKGLAIALRPSSKITPVWLTNSISSIGF